MPAPAPAGLLRQASARLKSAWHEPDNYVWITRFLQERGLLGSARLILTLVAGTAGLVPLSLLLFQRRPTTSLLTAQCIGIVLAAGMAVYWSKHWPTKRQSQGAVLTGLACIALWSQAQPNPALAAQVCTAAAITGGYIAFLHSTKLLAFNLAVALVIDVLMTVRLMREAGIASALSSFWLIMFVNVSVPMAIWGATLAIRLYAVRSTEDPLTGLLNRRAFTDTVLARLGDIQAADVHLHVLLIDLDDFKRVNDTFGHAAGDGLITSVANVIRSHTIGVATVCRAGGEEFLAAYTRSDADPVLLAGRLCTAIAELSPPITASIGVATATLSNAPRPITACFVDELIGDADQAMYTAKRGGGNQARLWPRHHAQQR